MTMIYMDMVPTGGMPEMVFEYILKKNGIDPQKDLTIDQSIDFGSTAAAFTGDDSAAYTVEFEPSATILEKEGAATYRYPGTGKDERRHSRHGLQDVLQLWKRLSPDARRTLQRNSVAIGTHTFHPVQTQSRHYPLLGP